MTPEEEAERKRLREELSNPGVVVDPVCMGCAWARNSTYEDVNGKWTCIAFYPDPIPEDIWNGLNDHSKPHPLQRPDSSRYVYRPTI